MKFKILIAGLLMATLMGGCMDKTTDMPTDRWERLAQLNEILPNVSSPKECREVWWKWDCAFGIWKDNKCFCNAHDETPYGGMTLILVNGTSWWYYQWRDGKCEKVMKYTATTTTTTSTTTTTTTTIEEFIYETNEFIYTYFCTDVNGTTWLENHTCTTTSIFHHKGGYTFRIDKDEWGCCDRVIYKSRIMFGEDGIDGYRQRCDLYEIEHVRSEGGSLDEI